MGNLTRIRKLHEQAGAGSALDDQVVEPPPGRPPAAAPIDDNAILDSMLGGEPGAEMPRRRSSPSVDPEFDRMVQEIADASSDGSDSSGQDRLRGAIDAELSGRVRMILSAAAYRELEASWTGLRQLVMSAETGPDLCIRVLALSQADLLAELEQARKLEETALYKLAAEPSSGSHGDDPCSLLLTDYSVDAQPESRRLLGYLMELGERAHLPILARAAGSALRLEDVSKEESAAWEELQRQPGARWIGLCAPQILLRRPYGRDTEPVDHFSFEEGAVVDKPESYLWGSAAFALARSVARARIEDGSLERLDRFTRLDGLPIHVYREGGEVRYQGPTDEFLTESRIEAWTKMGIIPVTAIRGQDSALITSLRSLAGTPLFGNG